MVLALFLPIAAGLNTTLTSLLAAAEAACQLVMLQSPSTALEPCPAVGSTYNSTAAHARRTCNDSV